MKVMQIEATGSLQLDRNTDEQAQVDNSGRTGSEIFNFDVGTKKGVIWKDEGKTIEHERADMVWG